MFERRKYIPVGYDDEHEQCEQDNAAKLRDDIRYMLATPYLYKPATVLATLIALDVVDVRIAFMKKTPRHERLFHDKAGYAGCKFRWMRPIRERF